MRQINGFTVNLTQQNEPVSLEEVNAQIDQAMIMIQSGTAIRGPVQLFEGPVITGFAFSEVLSQPGRGRRSSAAAHSGATRPLNSVDFDHREGDQPMVSDLDIYRAAAILVKRHGENAPIHAIKRADQLLDQGDKDGNADWLRIMRACEVLLVNEPEGTVD